VHESIVLTYMHAGMHAFGNACYLRQQQQPSLAEWGAGAAECPEFHLHPPSGWAQAVLGSSTGLSAARVRILAGTLIHSLNEAEGTCASLILLQTFY
jgi:hypothetical protein